MDTLLAILNMCIFPGGAFALLIGFFYKGLDRRVEARLQRRVGPPLIRYGQQIEDNQQIAHIIQALENAGDGNEGRAHGHACKAEYRSQQKGRFAGRIGDKRFLGSASSSPFGAMGFSREMSMMMAYETPLLLVLLSVAMLVGKSMAGGEWGAEFSLLKIVAWQQQNGSLGLNPVMIPAMIAYLIFLPGTMGVAPFDIPEAETEILEGPLLEYGGPLLALFQVASSLKTFVVLGLGVAMFFPGTICDWWWVNLLWFLFKCVVLMLLSLTLVKAATGRYRIGQAFRFYVTVPTALALCSLVLIWAL